MKTIVQLKKDLEFNCGLTNLIEVLKNLAVAQYKILEQKIKPFEVFYEAVKDFFAGIDVDKINHPFLKPTAPLAVIAITSDAGFLGGINVQVINTALLELEAKEGKLIVIGERGKLYAQENSPYPFVSFGGIVEEERYSQAMQLRNYLFKKIVEGAFKNIKVVYPHPVSFTVQRVSVVGLLAFPFLQEVKKRRIETEIIWESDIRRVIEYLGYLWIGRRLYDLFGLSKLAEFSARYVHLEESLQKLKEMENKLRLQYFRARHEMIDKNMRELFSARILYGKA